MEPVVSYQNAHVLDTVSYGEMRKGDVNAEEHENQLESKEDDADVDRRRVVGGGREQNNNK